MEAIRSKVFLLLVGSGLCSAFAGLQSIVVLEWLQPLLLLQFLHRARVLERKLSSVVGLLLLVLLTQTLGYTIAYAGELKFDFFTFHGVLISASLSLIAWVILLFVFVTSLYYEQRFPEAVLSHPFCFPVVWMTMWHTAASFSPIGTTGNPAYSQHGIQPMVLTAALFGVDGVVFFMALTASLVDQRLQLRQAAGQSSWALTTVDGAADYLDDDQGAHHKLEIEADGRSNGATASEGSRRVVNEKQSIKEFAKKVKRHDGLVKVWCSILILSLLFSGAKVVVFSGTFFEKGITETIKPTVGVSCILRQPNFDSAEAESLSSEFLWNATSERASGGDAFIVWSETATVVYGENGENELLSRAQEILSLEQENRAHLETSTRQIALDHGPYLGLSYAVVVDGKESGQDLSQLNVFTLMLPNGTVGFRYLKSKPVPFVEPETIPGPGQLEAVDTPFGTVSGAICFDYQFPRLIEQASYLGADIMIQPSWTWGPMANFQFKADAFRAVENGFTLLRCSSEGESGVVSPYNEFLDVRETAKTSVVTMQLPISAKVFTLYPYGGFLFGILVAVMAAKYIFMAWLPLSWVLALSNFFPGALNTFFIGDKFEEDMIGTKTYRRYKTKTRNSTDWEIARRPFFASSEDQTQ